MGLLEEIRALSLFKVKVGVLRPVQQPGSYWDRSSELPLVGLEPTEVTAYDYYPCSREALIIEVMGVMRISK